MTRNVVNLDALIPREDLAAPVEANADIPGLKISDLKPGLIYSWLRKPDFQRETANWSPEQVADLVETFANGNIIPAVILWQNGQRVFVIDGAQAKRSYCMGTGRLRRRFYLGHALPKFNSRTAEGYARSDKETRRRARWFIQRA